MGNSGSALGKKSTAEDVVRHFNANLTGKVAVVTGGNSGIGLETVRALAAAGCQVICGSRNVDAGKAAVAEWCGAEVAGRVSVHALDLESLASIKAFAEAADAAPSLDFLVCNAGIMALPTLQHTAHGFERQIGTNHFGHFYLVSLLRAKMVAAPTPSRIVVVSSLAHKMGDGVNVADLHYTQGRAYSAWGAYGQSKLANILFVKELADQLADTRVTVVSLHPGVIATNLARDLPAWMTSGVGGAIFRTFIVDKTIPQGAATTLYGCLDPALDSPAGRGAYLFDCAIATPTARAVDAKKELRQALWAATDAQLRAALGLGAGGAA